ncbi:MAG: cobalamin-dependent protein [Deltaproteobacteria bacterium]|nr:cobalamin-dependent protein [Deltaproteobacteria bacterium]
MLVLPMGMAFVAKAAEDAGHEVSQINLMAEPEALKTLTERIQAVQPDIIGISVRNIDDQASFQTRFLLDPVKTIVYTCRQNSEAKIVLGGAGYSIFPRHALTYLAADMGIQGEGEQSFVMLLGKLKNNEDLSDIPGLYHVDQCIANPPVTIKKIDQNHFPQPGRHIFALEHTGDEVIWLPFQTRRGCPLNCSYCSTPSIEGKITRRREPSLVIDALAAYVSAGFDHFFFVDNTFNLPSGYAKDLCDQIIESGLNISWRGILYPGKVEKDLIAKMAESGCVEVSLGLESGSDIILKKMNKHYQIADVRRASFIGNDQSYIRNSDLSGHRTGLPCEKDRKNIA